MSLLRVGLKFITNNNYYFYYKRRCEVGRGTVWGVPGKKLEGESGDWIWSKYIVYMYENFKEEIKTF